MKLAVDLHLHSCLSPCGDELMTPNNLMHMAALKGLDIVAVADHNCARNLPAMREVGLACGVCLLPAMELCTREEVHLLSYFPTVEKALAFSEVVYGHLPGIENRPEIFGEQQVMNAEDEVTGTVSKLLIQALDLPLDRLVVMIRAAGGAAVPAHINRGSNGLLNALGFMPPDAGFAAVEVSRGLPLPVRGMGHYRQMHSSDAHRLEDIFEREEFMELPERSEQALFAWLLEGYA